MKREIVRHWILLIVMAGAAFLKSGAQESRMLTLPEAVNLSLKNSAQLKYSSAKIEEATAALKEAVERKLPDAAVSGSYLRLTNPDIDLKLKTGTGGTGGTSESPKPSQAAYGIANITLPLYSGLRIKHGITAAKYLAEAATLDAADDKEALIANAIDAFNNLYKAKAALDLMQENLETARQRVADFSNLEKNGLLARNDLLKAQLQASNTELSLLDAQNNWKLANISMSLMLGLPDSIVLAPDSSNFQPATALQPLTDYLQSALQNRNDLAALALRKKAAATAIKATEGEKYPSLALTGGYAAIDVPKVLTVTNAVNLGIGVQYSLSSLWKTSAKVEQAKAREQALAATETQLSDAIRLQVAQAYQNHLLSAKKIEVYETAVTQATENYRILKNKYENSLATATDLLDADAAQLQARLNYAFAKSDAFVAFAKLLQASGTLRETSIK